MTRVHSHRAQFGVHHASAHDRPRAIRKRKPYKILLEAVTQEKKKLRSAFTYTADAPPGYTFVPAGHPDLTEYCKERCRKRNLEVHVVSAKPRSRAHENPEKISHHVHRIGYHFPNAVISEACDVLGYFFRNGVYHKSSRDYGETRLARSLADRGQRMRLHGRPATETESKVQVRDAVRDMFPKIPEADLTAIVTHAFEEGSKRVGNATELTLARRVQLAVVAHIRHTYTEYDHLLKVGSWSEARSKVEHVSLAKLREWRDEADSDELEETFREVIIIDDDDDDDTSDEDSISETDQREQSLEIISSRATARELQRDELDYVPRAYAHSGGRAPRRTIFLPMRPESCSLAVARNPNAYSTEQLPRAQVRPVPSLFPVRPAQQYQQPLHLAHSRPIDLRSTYPAPVPVARPPHALQMRGEDGRLYNLQPVGESSGNNSLIHANGAPRVEYASSLSSAPRYALEGYVRPPQHINSLESNQPSRFAPAVSSRHPSEQDLVIPSIEREPESIASARDLTAPQHLRKDSNSFYVENPDACRVETQAPKRKELHPSFHEGELRRHEETPKRIRPAYIGEETLSMSRPPPPPPMSPQSLHYEDVQSRPRMQPSKYGIVDLTSSSPVRPPHCTSRNGHVVPARSYTTARSDNYYAPVESRKSYHEIPTIGSLRFEQPIYPRMNERHYSLHEYGDMRDEHLRSQTEVGGRATRSGLVYGGYRVH